MVELVTTQTVIAVVPQPVQAIAGRFDDDTAGASIPVPTPFCVNDCASDWLYQICTAQLLSPLTGPQ